MRSERVRVWMGLVIVSTVWGSTWLAIKIGLEAMPPFFAAGMRFVVASAVLGAIMRARGLSVPLTPDARKTYLSLGILSFSIPFALAYWGQQFIPTGLSSILFAAFPFWVALFSQLMLAGERLDLFKIGGIVAGFFGIVLIFWHDFRLSDTDALVGMSAIVLGSVLQAYALVLVKKHGQGVSPFVMNFVGMAMGAIALLGLSALLERQMPLVWSPAAVGSILYLALVGSVLAFVAYYWLLKRIDAVYLSLTSFVNPLVAVVLGAVVLDEVLGPSAMMGAACVLVGICIANGRAFYDRRRVLVEE